MRLLPLAPVVQRAIGDVLLRITRSDGSVVEAWFTPGRAQYLTCRYARSMDESGLPWRVERTEER